MTSSKNQSPDSLPISNKTKPLFYNIPDINKAIISLGTLEKFKVQNSTKKRIPNKESDIDTSKQGNTLNKQERTCKRDSLITKKPNKKLASKCSSKI